MLVYYFLYLLPIIFALLWSSSEGSNRNQMFLWYFIGILFTFAIGFRHEVGGDWVAYLRHFQSMTYLSVEEVIQRADPGYYVINWFMLDWGYGIYSVNLICGALFMLGLIIFARRQPNPWLAIAVSVPYLIVVVAMGYTRQAVALGFVFWGLTALEKNNFKQFLLLMVFAVTFHKSAVLMIGLGIFLQGNGRIIRTLAVVAVGLGVYTAFLADYQENLWKNYVEVQLESQGAMIRVAMNFLPAVIFILFRKEWKQQFHDYSFWQMIALGCLVSVFLVSFASTAVDRIALYFIPIQVVVYARLPYLLKNRISIKITTSLILFYYLAVLYVWLNYATHARYWLPYQTSLFDSVL